MFKLESPPEERIAESLERQNEILEQIAKFLSTKETISTKTE